MKRTSFWLFVTVLTFALGVAAVFIWLNFQHSLVKPVQLDSTAESKNDIAPENPKKIDLERNRRLWQESKVRIYFNAN